MPVKLDPWIYLFQGVLYTWYQGQELANAAAAVLTRMFNPCGRLPITFPGRIEDCPAYSSFPGDGVDTYYAESIFVGYKCRVQLKPRIPLTMEVLITNTGSGKAVELPGRQTVISWLSQRSPHRIRRPHKQICGFAKSKPLSKSEQHMVKIKTEAYAFEVFDITRGHWVIDAGIQFDILIGSSADDPEVAWHITVPDEISWIH
ncbi:hypothetical protein DL765_006204 [Monosporascus sp. GIB2]|nr:hypothetical protein DL765_006204 [Monosporascus sp. GIB2]